MEQHHKHKVSSICGSHAMRRGLLASESFLLACDVVTDSVAFVESKTDSLFLFWGDKMKQLLVWWFHFLDPRHKHLPFKGPPK